MKRSSSFNLSSYNSLTEETVEEDDSLVVPSARESVCRRQNPPVGAYDDAD